MVEYCFTEDIEARRLELCLLCEQKSDPAIHVCKTMEIDSDSFATVMRNDDSGQSTRILTSLTLGNRPRTVRLLPALITVADLCEWSQWDLRHLLGIGPLSAKIIRRILRRGGLDLLDISYQAASARRTRLREEAIEQMRQKRQQTEAP